jgi:hypothetical protein
VSDEIAVSTNFSDPDIDESHVVVWDWGDGNQCVANSSGYCEKTDINGAVSVTGRHIYHDPGVYTILLSVVDEKGGTDEADFQYVVVYDPDGDFVTGGGGINSPVGAYRSDPSLTGKANFGFVSKYKKGATVPAGKTEFGFKAGDLIFHSNSYEWLVVTGSNYAKFKGHGTINGSGVYKFMLWAGDGAIDTFRIRIWSEDAVGTEDVIYDNGFDQELDGGSIVVHKQ